MLALLISPHMIKARTSPSCFGFDNLIILISALRLCRIEIVIEPNDFSFNRNCSPANLSHVDLRSASHIPIAIRWQNPIPILRLLLVSIGMMQKVMVSISDEMMKALEQ